jgi:PAS domain S-box-containing protein
MGGDRGKTKKQLVDELNALRSRLDELQSHEVHQSGDAFVFNDILLNAAVGVSMLDLKGKFLRANSFLCRMVGYSEKELQSMSFSDITHPDDIQKGMEQMQMMLSGKADHVWFEKRYLHKAGHAIHAVISPSLVRDERGEPRYFFGLWQDMSGRERAERELMLFSDALEQTMDGVQIVGLDGRVMYSNRAVEEIYGFSPDDLKGRHVNDMNVDPEFADREILPSIMRDGRWDGELMVRHKGGGEFPIWLSTSFIKDPTGQPIAMVGTIKDMSERKRAEKAIRESEEKYRSLVDNAIVGIYKTDLEGNLLYANMALANILEFDSPAELMSTGVLNTYKDPGQRNLLTEKLITNGKVDNLEIKLSTRTGRTKDVLVSATLEGNVISGMIMDINEIKSLEDQLRHAQKMEAIGTLTGGIAHEFNNIMTAIMGFGEFLQDRIAEDDPLRINVDMIIAASERAVKLTDGLLAYSRKQLTYMEPTNINAVIRTVEGFLSNLVGVDIDLRVKTSDGDLIALVDKAQIEQVLFNMTTNAMDAMPDGGTVTISSGLVDSGDIPLDNPSRLKTGRYVLVSVSDTGTGIEDGDMEKIFEPFYTTKAVGKGTGLGLSMVYGMVKKHDGYIFVDSKPGEGTTFRIYLPLAETVGEEVIKETSMQVAGGTETVLVAEDDEAVRMLMKEMLETSGYSVITAVDGMDAVDRFMKSRDSIDLLLFDVAMPGKNGLEAYEEISRTVPDVKVIFVSGYLSDDLLGRTINERGLTFLPKPVRSRELFKSVRDVLG